MDKKLSERVRNLHVKEVNLGDLRHYYIAEDTDKIADEIEALEQELFFARGKVIALKADNGLNRAEVEVERLLKVVAEKDAEIERLRAGEQE